LERDSVHHCLSQSGGLAGGRGEVLEGKGVGENCTKYLPKKVADTQIDLPEVAESGCTTGVVRSDS